VQNVLHYSALRTGVTFAVTAVSAVLWAGLAQYLSTRFGPKPVMIVGFVVFAVGIFSYTQIAASGSFASNLLPGYILVGFALPFTFIPISIAALAGVQAHEAGLASGLFNTAQQVGGSLGLAILSTLAASKTTNVLNGLHGSVSTAATSAAKVSGYHVAFIAAAVMLAAGALILATAVRRRDLESLSLELTPSAAAA